MNWLRLWLVRVMVNPQHLMLTLLMFNVSIKDDLKFEYIFRKAEIMCFIQTFPP